MCNSTLNSIWCVLGGNFRPKLLYCGSQQNDIKANRYLLRRTSVQSFRRCSSEGGLPCNTQLHFDSAESTMGLGKQAQPVIECACRSTGSYQRSIICILPTHTDSNATITPRAPNPCRKWLTVSFSLLFFAFILLFICSEDTVGRSFTHRFPWISWLAWLARQPVLSSKSPGTNRTHVAHVAHVPFLPFSSPMA